MYKLERGDIVTTLLRNLLGRSGSPLKYEISVHKKNLSESNHPPGFSGGFFVFGGARGEVLKDQDFYFGSHIRVYKVNEISQTRRKI